MINEQPEKVALGRRHEPVKHMRILAHRQMSKNPDRLPGRWQFVVTRKRNKDFVPDTADIDNRLGRQGIYEFAVKKGDHGNRYIVKRSYSGFSTSVRSTRFPFAVLKPLVGKNRATSDGRTSAIAIQIAAVVTAIDVNVERRFSLIAASVQWRASKSANSGNAGSV